MAMLRQYFSQNAYSELPFCDRNGTAYPSQQKVLLFPVEGQDSTNVGTFSGDIAIALRPFRSLEKLSKMSVIHCETIAKKSSWKVI
ncbi:MAG: hypothetical protein LBG86_00520 [Puniceicoccales bacterium]|jgi:hypothetical protein|nr:hypothetical protein [Puniceicoccales bacterium]